MTSVCRHVLPAVMAAHAAISIGMTAGGLPAAPEVTSRMPRAAAPKPRAMTSPDLDARVTMTAADAPLAATTVTRATAAPTMCAVVGHHATPMMMDAVAAPCARTPTAQYAATTVLAAVPTRPREADAPAATTMATHVAALLTVHVAMQPTTRVVAHLAVHVATTLTTHAPVPPVAHTVMTTTTDVVAHLAVRGVTNSTTRAVEVADRVMTMMNAEDHAGNAAIMLTAGRAPAAMNMVPPAAAPPGKMMDMVAASPRASIMP
jgi:hypothetical protein